MKRLLAFALAAFVSCGPSGPPEPQFGAEFVFKVLYLPSEPLAAVQKMSDSTRIIGRRLELLGFPHARVTIIGRDRLKIRIPGAHDANIRTPYSAFVDWESTNKIYELADAPTQEKYNATAQVPDGYFAMQNLPSEKRRKLAEDRTWDVDQIRVKSVPVVEWMSTITDAWVERSSQGAASWSTAFALSDEGLAKVGNAFRDSMKRSPPGLFVVVMNQVRWVGRINECGGTEVRIGEFSDEEEARFLAIIFLSQSLRATLGSDSSGKAVPKIPESLSYYGTPPAPSQNQKEVR